MTQNELLRVLEELRGAPAENEVFEFKTASNTFDTRAIGEYFSALSNEANLKSADCAWLIFGVNNVRQIVGSNYRNNRASLDNLKGEIAAKTTNGISFLEIYELTVESKRVVLFQIPPAPRGIPTAYSGHNYARNGEQLIPMRGHCYNFG